MREYAEIIRLDFEDYMAGVSAYFHCIDDERVRAFEEARIVTQEYGRFLEAVRD